MKIKHLKLYLQVSIQINFCIKPIRFIVFLSQQELVREKNKRCDRCSEYQSRCATLERKKMDNLHASVDEEINFLICF
jgi:hypothetical protein